MYMHGHGQVRWLGTEIWLRNGSHMLSMGNPEFPASRPSWTKISKWGYVHQWDIKGNVYAWACPGQVIQYWDLTAEWFPYVKYREIPNFPPVGHLGPEFQNEDMCINGAYKGMFMHGHDQVRWLVTEIWLRNGSHMLSIGKSRISRRSAILDRNFEMRICASMGHIR